MRWTVPIERLAVLTAHEAEVKRTSGIAKLQSALKAAGAIWTSGVIRVDVHNVRADGPEVKVIDMAKEKKDQEEHPPRSPSRRQSTRCSVTLGTRTHRYAEVD